MERDDWALLALATASDSGLTPVQLQKVLFILGRELPQHAGRSFYNFKPYHYGAFDSAVYRDAETLSQQGLVAITDGNSVRHYSATESGRRKAVSLRPQAPAVAVDYLEAVVKWAQGLDFQQLVKSVYAKYPDTSVNSVFRG